MPSVSQQTAQAGQGDWYCEVSDPGAYFSDVSKIKVTIHEMLPELLWHSDNTPWTMDELEAEVQFIIERIMDLAPSAMPPIELVGTEPYNTPWLAQVPTDTIAIRPNDNNCGDANLQRGPVYGGSIVRPAPSGPCQHRRDHWSYSTSSGTTLGGVLVHEIYHGLGFAHWSACANGMSAPACTDNPGEPAVCSTMQAHGLSSEGYELEHADWQGLETLYGGWEDDDSLERESTDASSWTTRLVNWVTRPFVGSDWSQGSTLLPIATTNSSWDPQFLRYSRASNSFSDWGSPYSFGRQMGQISAGVEAGARYLFFGYGQNNTNTKKKPRFSRHTSSTNRTTHYPNDYMGRHGHNGTKDLRSGRVIHSWRTKTNNIVLGHSAGTSVAIESVELTGTDYEAAHTASVSCGPTSIYYNCIMVWASSGEGGEHKHRLHWRQFRVTGTGSSATFRFATAYSNGYTMYGPPSVTYMGPSSSSHAFVVAFDNPGRCMYTLRKGQYSYNAFGTERGHCGGTGDFQAPPMIGTTSPNYAEVWSGANEAN